MRYKTRKLFDNCKMHDMHGNFIAYTSKKKVMWYVDKDIADIISQNGDEVSIKLRFKPKKETIVIRPFNVGARDNICACCGTMEELTIHHIVPYEYRKLFDEVYMKHNTYDIIGLCIACHRSYEKIAGEFKKQLYKDFIPAYYLQLCKDYQIMKSLYRGLKSKKSYPMQTAYINKSIASVMDRWCGIFSTPEELLNYKPNQKKYIINNIGIELIIYIWQYHFMDTVKPIYMPDWWEVGKIYTSD